MRKITPNLSPRSMVIDVAYVNHTLGLRLRAQEVKELLERMRYGVEVKGDILNVKVPAYRADVLHPIDVVEDVAIAYGYQNFEPELPKLPTLGKSEPIVKLERELREVMLGLGFQEVKTLMMTSPVKLFTMMNVKEEQVVTTEKPVSMEHSVVRNWLLPSLMEVLRKNKTREYPQRIFEVGLCVSKSGEIRKVLSCVIAHAKANFAEIKGVVGRILTSFKLEDKAEVYTHGSFIPGRCALNKYGFYGELHPKVITNFGLEVPVVGLELNVDKIFRES